eukprot:TRINITY_DN23628_c0_g1_i1.p1 TRINITY_DN23628_c0_g1~~TRINITY_DN23628_c0_g1_i1.p1  ORF type:complete len:119 (+),score=24.17 TRINITY_DN23628_c0_g1_i1:75-431(+)
MIFFLFFFLMIRRPPRSTLSSSSAASDVYKRQPLRLLPQPPQLAIHRRPQQIKQPHQNLRIQPSPHRGIGPCTALYIPVSYTHLRAHETPEHLVCRLLLEKKKKKHIRITYTRNNNTH